MNMSAVGTIAILLGAAAAAPVAAATYVTDTAMFAGLGDELGTTFDQATLNSVTGTASGPGTYLINTVDFLAGLNSNDNHVDSGTFTNTATVDGTPFSYSVPYTISINSSDTLTLGGNSFTTDGYKVTFNTLTLTSGGELESGNLTATIAAVPEPATWALMLIGFGGLGAAVRTSRRQPASA